MCVCVWGGGGECLCKLRHLDERIISISDFVKGSIFFLTVLYYILSSFFVSALLAVVFVAVFI